MIKIFIFTSWSNFSFSHHDQPFHFHIMINFSFSHHDQPFHFHIMINLFIFTSWSTFSFWHHNQHLIFTSWSTFSFSHHDQPFHFHITIILFSCKISDFRRGVFKNFDLLGFYMAYIGSWLPTFRDALLTTQRCIKFQKRLCFNVSHNRKSTNK
jgi:hypothetical protein